MKTTLKRISKSRNNVFFWDQLVTGLGCRNLLYYENSDDIPDIEVSIRFILENNGLEDTLRVIECIEGYDREKRLLGVSFAKQVKHLMSDQRSLNALYVSEKYANGLATGEELKNARVDALKAADSPSGHANSTGSVWCAACYAAWAAYDAAFDAIRNSSEAYYIARCASLAEENVARYSGLNVDIAINTIEELQIKELTRMLDCIENGEVYNI